MQVTLVDYTGFGTRDAAHYAASMLIFAKSTRLEMTPNLLSNIDCWPKEKIEDELRYIANTIPSSWEFVDLTFLVQGVSRNFTHQFVRSRHSSFAQQTFRVLEIDDFKIHKGPTIEPGQLEEKIFEIGANTAYETYKSLLAMGVKAEDARDILPTGTLTNILMKGNLRNFVELCHKRTSPRVQEEYRLVLQAMKDAALNVYPWITYFIERTADKVFVELDQHIMEIAETDKRTKMLKLVDQLRSKL